MWPKPRRPLYAVEHACLDIQLSVLINPYACICSGRQPSHYDDYLARMHLSTVGRRAHMGTWGTDCSISAKQPRAP